MYCGAARASGWGGIRRREQRRPLSSTTGSLIRNVNMVRNSSRQAGRLAEGRFWWLRGIECLILWVGVLFSLSQLIEKSFKKGMWCCIHVDRNAATSGHCSPPMLSLCTASNGTQVGSQPRANTSYRMTYRWTHLDIILVEVFFLYKESRLGHTTNNSSSILCELHIYFLIGVETKFRAKYKLFPVLSFWFLFGRAKQGNLKANQANKKQQLN